MPTRDALARCPHALRAASSGERVSPPSTASLSLKRPTPHTSAMLEFENDDSESSDVPNAAHVPNAAVLPVAPSPSFTFTNPLSPVGAHELTGSESEAGTEAETSSDDDDVEDDLAAQAALANLIETFSDAAGKDGLMSKKVQTALPRTPSSAPHAPGGARSPCA